ncbi:MAG: bifunctional methylenetetrahydrofolate dehydrogenase/methenyltetrahydrofolate cyclohydrolase FolD [Clostridia bacterium]|jgi:methylenetetrahydrofolate dehydrogenase (NADP+)/methenyltetrahydrofolate cyclohydrolase|nr:bifunctional methylenetetrahydrofolate dehydrogenase/methenyltetrahydrofolate cyclohydrolase FolD [Clostridia bacterium]
MQIIDGKQLAKDIRINLKQEVDKLKEKNILPKLAVIMVGDDKASKVYVKNKSKACEEIGIKYEEYLLKEDIKMTDLLDLIHRLNEDNSVHGILLQSPLPKGLDINQAFKQIDEKKDVDGFNPINIGKLSLNEDCFISCTPHGVIKMLEAYNIEIEGKNAVIVGRSNIVGKPLLQCLLNKNATVTICHSKTKNIQDLTKTADILIAALGKPKFIKENMVKPGAVVIDVGINRTQEGKLIGDVDFEEVSKKAAYITPVPGGVGPMTIAMLMVNLVKAAKQLNKI